MALLVVAGSSSCCRCRRGALHDASRTLYILSFDLKCALPSTESTLARKYGAWASAVASLSFPFFRGVVFLDLVVSVSFLPIVSMLIDIVRYLVPWLDPISVAQFA